MNRTDKKYNDVRPNNSPQNQRTRSTDQERDLGYVSGDGKRDKDADAEPADVDREDDVDVNDEATSLNNADADNDHVSNDRLPPVPRA